MPGSSFISNEIKANNSNQIFNLQVQGSLISIFYLICYAQDLNSLMNVYVFQYKFGIQHIRGW